MYPGQDQHFLKDRRILYKIVEMIQLYKEDTVLEIGAGNGELTRILAKKSRVIAVEIDPELCRKLEKIENTRIICGNALEILDRKDVKFDKIVSNIPYSISEPLFTKLLTKEFKAGVFLIGSNFFEVLKSNSKLGMLARSFFNIKLELEVPKSAFEPEPRVDSVAVIVRPKTKLSKADMIIHSLVRQQDKKVKNALLKYYEGKKTKNEVREMIEPLGDEILGKGILQLSNEEMEKVAEFAKDKNI